MKDKKAGQKALTADETRIIEGLRRNPLIMERVRSILDLAQNAEGPLKTADQIEELLIEEIRKLGSATMHEWAAQAEQRVTEELQKDDPSLLSRKKKR